MPKRLLLLSPAKAPEPRWAVWLRHACIAAGIVVIVVALADITSRLATRLLGDGALFDAFAPAAAIKPSAAAVPAAPASSSEAFVPARLKVPGLGIDAKVEEVGTRADGAMGTPADFMNVGWWSEGSRPGGEGNAVFAGHVNNALTQSGVFEHLSQIHKGDYVTVSDANGRTRVYEVSEVTLYEPDRAPLREIFATTGPSRLVLITCEGAWVASEREFDKRLVVVARPAY